MEKDFRLSINHKQFIKYIKIVLIVALLVLETLICAQYITNFSIGSGTLRLIIVTLSCIALAVLETIDAFAIKNSAAKMVLYGFDSALLLVLCIFTGNTYISTIYCIVLTQFYISVDRLKTNIILFGVSCGLFIASLITSSFVVSRGLSLYQVVAQVIGDCVLGVIMLAVHCTVTNFLLKFYSQNTQLKEALKEADESKTQLKEVYEQLSQTAVFEERNRIAKDIHDNAGHSMTTVIMQTEAAKLLIDSNPQEAKNRIISANIQAKNALDQMRESVHLLAGRVQTNTLKEEIEEIIAQTVDGTELKIRYDLENVTVDAESYRFILNSVKESFANGLRHGNATAFYVEMKNMPSGVNILISDNGRGSGGEVKEGFGLKSIREKAEALGGSCMFRSEADEGFETKIILPPQGKKENI